jgi:cytochrome c-type biogenesis protein CcmH
MIWLAFGVMLLAALAIVTWPLYRRHNGLSANTVTMMATMVAVAALMYWQIGSPTATSLPAGAGVPAIEEMVASLAERLQQEPDDLNGWKMLGRSYLQLRRFPEAISAFERAVEIESSANGQTLADLGEVVLMQDQNAISDRAGQLFESALALEPANPKALFYAGMAAINRGDNELAATRWEALLATSPPENVREILRQRIAELRGQAPPPTAAPTPMEPAAPVVTVNVEAVAEATGLAPESATVFIIARDPNQPSPPIAAVRRQVSELPAAVTLGDSDAMIPGRVPSGFAQLEIVARISMSGQPIAQSGDWFGSLTISPATERVVTVVIDEQVP